ncbi:Gfo/Idh/MocA family oxidoreductase, partial [Alphaproteobacteria bacterium]|nr:Gfo/Idh/MocA family oxidoreductase [Alphaproteobacteria bacterium]
LNGKHVMVEKPVVLYKKQAEKVIKTWKDSKCHITSNLILRQSPRFKNLKKNIENNKFGEIYHIEGDYLHNILHKIVDGWRGKMPFYSTVYGGGIHLIDLMRWLIRDEIKEVSSVGNNILTENTNYKYLETVCALFKFKGGATGKSLSTYGPKRTKFHSLNVYGTKKTFVNNTSYAEVFSGDNEKNKVFDKSAYPGFEKGDLLPEFIDCILKNKEPEVSGLDIFRVMDVCFAIMESYNKRKTIKISYLM